MTKTLSPDQAERAEGRLRCGLRHALNHQHSQPGIDGGILADLRWLLAVGGALLLLKAWFAWQLDLHSDEVFYWLASTRPALAYSDLPFVTALLAGLGDSLAPGNPLGVRALFLAGGTCLPAVMYWLALPYVGRQDALRVAFLSVCLPLGGFLGLLATPDTPMLLFGLLSLGLLERALRLGAGRYWLGAGLFLALGLCTHYRFLPYVAATALFLAWQGGSERRNPWLWAAAALVALGTLPMLWANFAENLGSAGFYFVERHPWRFEPESLRHLPMQMLLVTPPLYALLLYSAWLTWKAGTARAQLLLWFSLPHLLGYALLSPWADANSTTEHWPLPGYPPLLAFPPQPRPLPSARCRCSGRTSRTTSAARHSL